MQTFIIGALGFIGQALRSTTQLILLNRAVRLQVCGSLLGQYGEIDRLVDSLQVGSGFAKAELGWTPPVAVADGVWKIAQWCAELQVNRA